MQYMNFFSLKRNMRFILPTTYKIFLFNNWKYDHALFLYEEGINIWQTILSFIKDSLANGDYVFFSSVYSNTIENYIKQEFEEAIRTGKLHIFYMRKNPFYEIRELNNKLQTLLSYSQRSFSIVINFGDIASSYTAEDIISCIEKLKRDEKNTLPILRSVVAFEISSLPLDLMKILLGFYKNVILSTKNENVIFETNFNTLTDSLTVNTFSRKALERFIKKHLEIIILSMLLGGPHCGYDLIRKIYMKYHTFLSQGTVYPILYNLYKQGFLSITNKKRAKIYTLTEKGRIEAETKIKDFISTQIYILNTLQFKERHNHRT